MELNPFEAEEKILSDYPILSNLVSSHPDFYHGELFGLYNRVQAREINSHEFENFADLMPHSENPDDLEEIAAILIDGNPSPKLLEAIGYHLLEQARTKREEIRNTRQQGRPAQIMTPINNYMLMESVYTLKEINGYTWQKITDIINKIREPKAVKKETLMREYRKFKKENALTIESWDKNGTLCGLNDSVLKIPDGVMQQIRERKGITEPDIFEFSLADIDNTGDPMQEFLDRHTQGKKENN